MVSQNLNFCATLIIGPTASGKTAHAHKLFEEQGSEIVNLDAFQIYREMNIGTAKPTSEELVHYKYHGIDVCDPWENLDANEFAKRAHKACRQIADQNKTPICVGGSGLYLRAFLHGLNQLPPHNQEIREHIRTRAQNEGWPACHAWLNQLDPQRALQLHPNDKVRIERALEICLLTSKPMSENLTLQSKLSSQTTLFPCYVIHMEPNKEELRKRIEHRIQEQLSKGWIEEVEMLLKCYGKDLLSFQSMRAIGYEAIARFILEGGNLEELTQKIANATWQYAKRQMTWNAKEKKDISI